MSPAFTTRRRAEDFNRLVEARRGTVTPGAGSGGGSGELADLAAFAAGLREVPEVAPRADFSADLRERLMAAAATELTPAVDVTDRLSIRTAPETRRRRERRITVGVAALAIVGASAGTALASQGALPGEPLYPVKRVIENVRTDFTPSDSGRAATLLGDAGTRLDEVGKLARRSDDSAEIVKTLDAFSEQATHASDLLLRDYQQHQDTASIRKLQTFTAASIDQLTALEPLLPDAAKQALTDAAQTVLTIDTAAHNACPACGGNHITSLPESLLTPVSTTLGSAVQTPDHAADESGTHQGKGAGKGKHHAGPLPSVPADVGPANVAPSSGPGEQQPSTTNQHDDSNPVRKLLPPKPTSAPSTLDDTVKGVKDGVKGTLDGVKDGVKGTLDGVDGTVGGVLGGVDDLVGGLLGSNKSTGP